MICPKCEEGTIKTVVFRNIARRGNLCDFCETVWFENEEISQSTGHPFECIAHQDLKEYTLENTEETDEKRSPKHTDYK